MTRVEAYTDASFCDIRIPRSSNLSRFTYSYVIIVGGHVKTTHFGRCPAHIRKITQAEMYATLVASDYVFSQSWDVQQLMIWTDCMTVVEAFTQKSNKIKSLQYRQLGYALQCKALKASIEFCCNHVKGHGNNIYNRMAHKLAWMYAKKIKQDYYEQAS